VLLASASGATRHVAAKMVQLAREHVAVVAWVACRSAPIVRLRAVADALTTIEVGHGASGAARHRLPARLASSS
jgi:hypothetical protein